MNEVAGYGIYNPHGCLLIAGSRLGNAETSSVTLVTKFSEFLYYLNNIYNAGAVNYTFVLGPCF